MTSRKTRAFWTALLLTALSAAWIGSRAPAAEYIWIEGEAPKSQNMTRHPWWYDKVKKDQLSGGDFISNWTDKQPGEATYDFRAKAARTTTSGSAPTRRRQSSPTNSMTASGPSSPCSRPRITSTSPKTARSTCGSLPGSRWAQSSSPRATTPSSSRCTATTTTMGCWTVSCLPAAPSRPRANGNRARNPTRARWPPRVAGRFSRHATSSILRHYWISAA